ncbi:MAG: hypothetical protein ACLSWI_05675 [Candidatus Gastranaerophilaceae bacterium]
MNYPYSNNAVMYPRQVRQRRAASEQTNPFTRPPLEKVEISPAFMEAVSAEVFKNQALGNMLTKNTLRYGMSISDYGASLMRQGKIPEKDFVVDDNILTEINKRGERFKDTVFINNPDNSSPTIECNYYNSYTQEKFKTIRYTPNGEQTIRYNMDVPK